MMIETEITCEVALGQEMTVVFTAMTSTIVLVDVVFGEDIRLRLPLRIKIQKCELQRYALDQRRRSKDVNPSADIDPSAPWLTLHVQQRRREVP